jgi:hypothetical protein
MAGKVVDMPERQLVGAIEQQLDSLAVRVEDALQASERERDGRSLADEAQRLLAGGGSAARGGAAMAFGVGERPENNPAEILATVDYPADREDIVGAAEDAEASVDVINLLKCLPRDRYDSEEMALRDLAEAARRFGMGGHAPLVGSVDRRNLGRDAVEENVDGNPKHP